MNNNPSPKQKWLLTAALVAILGANYSYQVSSLVSEKTMGSFELASNANEVETQNEAYMEQQREQAQARAAKARTTQAGTTETGACADCGNTVAAATVTMSLAEHQKVLSRIASQDKKIADLEAAAKAASEKASSDVAKKEKDEEEKPKKETATEKRLRLAQEKREAEMKKREDLAKIFTEEVKAIKALCDTDLECAANEFTKTLRENYSSKETALPAGYVTNAYKSLVGSRLSRMLYSGDSAEGLTIIESLMESLPERYKGIKESIMSSIHTSSVARAQNVNTQYKTLQALSKQNNPEAFFKQLAVTQAEHQALQDQATMYSVAVESHLGTDISALNYYERTYMPNMRKLMNSLNNPAGIDASGATTVESTSATTRANNGRGGRTTTVQVVGDKVTTTTTRGGTTNSQQEWTVGNQPNSGTVLMGKPSTAPQGTRGARQ